jgi:hypothetical protein
MERLQKCEQKSLSTESLNNKKALVTVRPERQTVI